MAPYLSIVLCGRNDDYGKNYLGRLQTFLYSVDFLSEKYQLDAQVVFVEWNPPEETKAISEVVDWGKHIRVKIITVPPETHRCIPTNHEKSGLHEFIAKNVGIRRADGEYILSCTTDLVFSDALFKYLAQKKLSQGAFYRSTRINMEPVDCPSRDAIPDTLEQCIDNVYEANLLSGNYPIDRDKYAQISKHNVFANFWHDPLHRGMFGFYDQLEPVCIEAQLLKHFPHLLFTNAAGDFMLLSKQDWVSLGGHLENDCRNHMDALICFRAVEHGLSQIILPPSMAVFHQRHDFIPLADYFTTLKKYKDFRNTQNWGLVEQVFPEIEINV